MKILTLSDAGAVSFYRAHGPLLENGVEVLHPRVAEQIDWVDIMAADAVWMTRALLADHVEICKQVKAVGKPLVLDCDDAIFSVPVSNPNWKCNEEYSLVSDDAIERDAWARKDFMRVLSDIQNL